MNDSYDEQLLLEAYELYKEELASRKGKDYVVNLPQFIKYWKAKQFFEELTGGSAELDINPLVDHGGITISGYLFYFKGEDLKRLSEIIGDMCALTIDANLDGLVSISFNIPGVYSR